MRRRAAARLGVRAAVPDDATETIGAYRPERFDAIENDDSDEEEPIDVLAAASEDVDEGDRPVRDQLVGTGGGAIVEAKGSVDATEKNVDGSISDTRGSGESRDAPSGADALLRNCPDASDRALSAIISAALLAAVETLVDEAVQIVVRGPGEGAVVTVN